MNTPTAPTILRPQDCMAMVVQNISVWNSLRTNNKLSKSVAAQHNADSNAVSTRVDLMAGTTLLKQIKSTESDLRDVFKELSSPFLDGGYRTCTNVIWLNELCPAALPHGKMREPLAKFDSLADEFSEQYEFLRISQDALGDLHDMSKYPDPATMRDRFNHRVSMFPLPSGQHFSDEFFDDAQADADQWRAETDDFVKTQLHNGKLAMYDRLYKPLNNMATKLHADNTKRFAGTLVSNVLDMVEILRTCNADGDIQMTSMCDNLEDALRGVTCEALRDSSQLRVETKRKVDQAIASLPTLDIL